eukprot:TRINITY_DN32312_c0_g1_i1.p1 TRINITY_DN32312_c0_g1~~TRINITY_DN32312_c0_g1_i1.p1  ORF type:complete len:535 (-),score=97.43 TRINITY_DN32312_c0_g1_i1:33-1550(-)
MSSLLRHVTKAARSLAREARSALDEAAYAMRGEAGQLDLTYIQPNIIAMSFPFSSDERTKGNDIREVAAFLKRRHAGHYMVWNLSERQYTYTLFENNVLEYGFKEHHGLPLDLLFKVCHSLDSWLKADKKNVAVVHCLTGRVRTGTVIACYLTYNGFFDDGVEALRFFLSRRAFGSIPSQERYVQYFTSILRGVVPEDTVLRLRRLIVNTVPRFDEVEGGGCRPLLQVWKGRKLLWSSSWDTGSDAGRREVKSDPEEGEQTPSIPTLMHFSDDDGSFTFPTNCLLHGDISFKCFHVIEESARVPMFRAIVHTGFLKPGMHRLLKKDMDAAYKDDRFNDDFFLDLVLETADSSELPEDYKDEHDRAFWNFVSTRQGEIAAASSMSNEEGGSHTTPGKGTEKEVADDDWEAVLGECADFDSDKLLAGVEGETGVLSLDEDALEREINEQLNADLDTDFSGLSVKELESDNSTGFSLVDETSEPIVEDAYGVRSIEGSPSSSLKGSIE